MHYRKDKSNFSLSRFPDFSLVNVLRSLENKFSEVKIEVIWEKVFILIFLLSLFAYLLFLSSILQKTTNHDKRYVYLVPQSAGSDTKLL